MVLKMAFELGEIQKSKVQKGGGLTSREGDRTNKLQIKATHTETLSTDFLFWLLKCLRSNRLIGEGAVTGRVGRGDVIGKSGNCPNRESGGRNICDVVGEVLVIGKSEEIHNRESREKK